MHPMETLHIANKEQLTLAVKKAFELFRTLRVVDTASVIALEGTLGAGKTAFVKALAHECGVEDEVTSPTFVVMKRYQTGEVFGESQAYTSLVHIDAYRVDSEDEMRPLRFKEVLEEEHTLICIEWAERIEKLLPKNTLHIKIEIEGEELRTFRFQ